MNHVAEGAREAAPPSSPTVEATAGARRTPEGAARDRWPLPTIVLAAVLALTVALTVAGDVRRAGWPLASAVGPQQWISAHFLVIGRTFAEAGLGALHGIPLQNNLPSGPDPDYYVHWPPLFSYVVGGVVALTGTSEAPGRLLMLGILLAGVLALFALVRRVAGLDAALLAAIAYLCLPVVLTYHLVTLPLSLALCFAIVGVHLFLKEVEDGGRRWGALGVLAIAAGVATTWEVALLPPVLLGAALRSRERRRIRLASAYAVAAAVTGAAVLGWYALNAHGLFGELLATVRLRAGGGYVRPEPRLFDWCDVTEYGSYRPISLEYALHVFATRLRLGLRAAGSVAVALLPAVFLSSRLRARFPRIRLLLAGAAAAWVFWFFDLFRALAHEVELLRSAPGVAVPGGLHLAAIALVLAPALALLGARRDRAGDAPLVFAALVGPWLLWFVGMSNHAVVHEYELMLAAPATAFAVGVVACAGWPVLVRHPLARWGAVGVAVLLVSAAAPTFRHRLSMPAPADDGLVALGRDLRAGTPRSAVIFQAVNSMVPLYYSERTTVRGAMTPGIVERMRRQASELFPGRELILAIPRGPVPPALQPLVDLAGARRAAGGSILVPLEPAPATSAH